MKVLIDKDYEDVVGVFIVPDDFDIEADRKLFFKKDAEENNRPLRRDGWPMERHRDAAFSRHCESMVARFGNTKWEYA